MNSLMLTSTILLASFAAALVFPGSRAKIYSNLIKWNFINKDWPEQFAKVKVIVLAATPKTTAERRRLSLIILGAFTCLIICRVIHYLTPLLLRRILDIIEAKSGDFPWMPIILYVLLRHLIWDFMVFVQWVLTRRLECQIEDTINMSAYCNLMSLSTDYQEAKKTAWDWGDVRDVSESVRRFINESVFDYLPLILDTVITFVSFDGIKNARMSLMTLLILACYSFTVFKTSPRSEKQKKEYDLAMKARNVHAGETIANWWIVWSFDKIEDEKRRCKEVMDTATKANEKWADDYWLDHNLKNLVISCGLIYIWLTLARDVWEGKQDNADFMMFIYSWGSLMASLQSLLNWHTNLRIFVLDIEDLVTILRLTPSVQDAENAIDYEPHEQGSISCHNVTFQYKGTDAEENTDSEKSTHAEKGPEAKKTAEAETTPVLHNVSFEVKRGTMVALVGQSGGGKTTLLKLMKRCYDPDEGQILLDGQDIKSFCQNSLSHSISLVPQSIGAFKRSLLDNVRYPRPSASIEECEAVCAAVGLEDIPLDTQVGDGGTLLSGGQLQRLAIARALIHDPAILFLDEATSSLDSETEEKVKNTLVQWQKQKNRTIVMVVHAFKSILDRENTHVIAMKDGRIVEQGKEAELLAKKGYYYELWEKQRLGEPLD